MAGGAPGTTKSYHRSSAETSDQIKTGTKGRASQGSDQEYEVEINMAGDVTCDPTVSLTVQGTQSAFDRTYTIKKVVHYFSVDSGYHMHITGEAGGDGSGGGGGGEGSGGSPADGSGDSPDNPDVSSPGQGIVGTMPSTILPSQ